MDIKTDDDGFLLDPEDWSEEVARYIADHENVELTDERWKLIRTWSGKSHP